MGAPGEAFGDVAEYRDRSRGQVLMDDVCAVVKDVDLELEGQGEAGDGLAHVPRAGDVEAIARGDVEAVG